ncbi:PLDc N-terminal domain-containing protein [Massilia sp. LXY-6]|uniref:PLDc N-terminal domain-containing protein n=1 Tax=Massilia sp. LXY-6 TaxID=3379823 RepID=UPI003EDE9259
MQFFGIGIHIIIAIFFAVHAVRTQREMVWLLVLFLFPLLGSIVYFVAVFLPSMRLDHSAAKAGRALQAGLDPGREVREAQRAFELTPTAHNQMRLASALLETGQAAKAAEQYDACLQGPFARDAELRLGAAHARLAGGNAAGAIALLEALAAEQPNFRPEQVGILLGQAYAAAGRQDEAGAQFAAAAQRFGSLEARAELAIWALANGKPQVAEPELQEIERTRKHMPAHSRTLNRELFRRVDAARAQAR